MLLVSDGPGARRVRVSLTHAPRTTTRWDGREVRIDVEAAQTARYVLMDLVTFVRVSVSGRLTGQPIKQRAQVNHRLSYRRFLAPSLSLSRDEFHIAACRVVARNSLSHTHGEGKNEADKRLNAYLLGVWEGGG